MRIEVLPEELSATARSVRETGRGVERLVPTAQLVGVDVLDWAPDLTLQDAVVDLVELLQWALRDVGQRADELADDLVAAAATYAEVDFLEGVAS